jgi:hypothetical protein
MTIARITIHVALPAKTLRDDKQTGGGGPDVIPMATAGSAIRANTKRPASDAPAPT